MKLLKHLTIIITLCIYTSSCKKKFLDVPTKSEITLQEHVKDLATTFDYLNGLYLQLSLNYHAFTLQVYPELVADNIKPLIGSPFSIPIYKWSQPADAINGTLDNCNGTWLNGYRIIRGCSFVINKVDEYREQNPVKADDIKGQAFALRAMIHFDLVNTFAQSYNFTSEGSHQGIPYITAYDFNEPVSGRLTVGEVYANMISDLNQAISLISETASSTVYMNLNAAKALLARIYLFKEDWANAKNFASEVGRLKPIMLTNYPTNLFTLQETEALFQLPPSARVSLPSSTGSYTGTYDTQFLGGFLSGPYTLYLATADITDLLKQDTRDIRQSWVNSGSDNTIVKFPTDVVPGFDLPAMSYYHTLLRSSEMYLTAAEGYARLNNNDSARFYLNAIRTRAGLDMLADNITGTSLLDSIYTERRKELAFEGLRMYDLLRWKKVVSRQDALDASAQNLPYPSNKAIAPIPTTDVQLMGLTQNPGY